MTPASLLARKRALLALSGAAVPIPEVEVEEVPTDAPTDFPTADVDGPRHPMAAPSAVSTGEPQQASARDYYQEALGERRQRRLGADITRVGGNLIEALSGAPADRELVKTLESRADQPVVEYLKRQQEADKRRALELRGVRTGAGKPAQTDEQARAAFRALYPDSSEAEVNAVNAANFESARKTAEGKAGRGVTMRGQTLTSEANAARLRQGAKQHVEEMGYKWESLSHEDQRAAMRLEEMRIERDIARSDRQAEQLNRDVEGLGKDLEDVGSMRDDLITLRSGAFKSDIPGVGIVDARKPGFMQGQADIAVRQAVRGIVSRLLKAQSGSTVSEQELDRKLEELGMGEQATEPQFRSGLNRLERDVGATLRARESRHTPEAVKKYKERGGVTSVDMPKPGAPRVPASTILPKDSSGQPTLDAPPAGFARVKMKDGTVLRIPVSDLHEALRDPDVVGEVK